MATFSKSTFNASKYAASRPHYPTALYSHVLAYAAVPRSSSPRTLVDIGCGPGLSTFSFAPHFDRVIGVDPSANMIDAANSILHDHKRAGKIGDTEFVFAQGRGDKLDKVKAIQAESVDLVVAGQAAHWFDPLPTYKSLARVLKPGGSFCFWGYGEIFFPRRPELSALIPPYSGKLLGPYWEQPGRSIVEALLVPFPLPLADNFASNSEATSICSAYDASTLQRTFHLDSTVPTSPVLEPAEQSAGVKNSRHDLLLTKQLTLQGFEGYLRTWSSLHKYDEEHRGGTDVAKALIERMKEAGWQEGEEVEAAWQVGMVMGKKSTS
ncbi:class I SAM-dependent methyltransferase [Sporobolomyces koalae]|uniref:class I SAM-dependent methyltransferase n=1 Tax=Sporobolomyces koalae TaxID=500713 RepID=UPI0031800D1B